MLDIFPQDEGALFEAPQLVTKNLVANIVADVIGGDPARVLLVLSIGGSVPIWVNPQGIGSFTGTGQGWQIATNVGYVKLTWKDDGPLCQLPWQAITSGGTTLNALSVSLVRHPEMYGYLDLFKTIKGPSIHDHAALHRASRRGGVRSTARRITPFQERLLRWRAPHLFPSEG